MSAKYELPPEGRTTNRDFTKAPTGLSIARKLDAHPRRKLQTNVRSTSGCEEDGFLVSQGSGLAGIEDGTLAKHIQRRASCTRLSLDSLCPGSLR